MRAIINGKTYDTDKADGLQGADCGTLYQTRRGDFFVIEVRESRAGLEAYPCERTDPRQALRNFAFSTNNSELLAEAEAMPDAIVQMRQHWEILIPMTREEAAAWAIKAALPDCFHDYLLEKL